MSAGGRHNHVFAGREIYFAYMMWKRHIGAIHDDDIAVAPFLLAEKKGGWLARTREASFLSAVEIAKRLDISSTAYAKLERNEIKGTITLQSLEAVANAMDCEVVYAIRPRGEPISCTMRSWRSLLEEARPRIPVYSSLLMHFRGFALAGITRDLTYTSKTRRRHGWSKRKFGG